MSERSAAKDSLRSMVSKFLKGSKEATPCLEVEARLGKVVLITDSSSYILKSHSLSSLAKDKDKKNVILVLKGVTFELKPKRPVGEQLDVQAVSVAIKKTLKEPVLIKGNKNLLELKEISSLVESKLKRFTEASKQKEEKSNRQEKAKQVLRQ